MGRGGSNSAAPLFLRCRDLRKEGQSSGGAPELDPLPHRYRGDQRADEPGQTGSARLTLSNIVMRLASRQSIFVVAPCPNNDNRNGMAKMSNSKTVMARNTACEKRGAHDQNPHTLTERRPRRVSTMRSPPLVGELP